MSGSPDPFVPEAIALAASTLNPSRPRRSAAAVASLVALALGLALAVAIFRPFGAGTSSCPPIAGSSAGWSAARRWDEALLDAIRRDFPMPTVHARNLFHLSAAMWDAWAAYDPTAEGYRVTEKLSAWDREAARREAISFAAYRLLSARYIGAYGADRSLSQFDDLMDSLCYDLADAGTDGDSPAHLGNRIAAAYIADGADDGANEAGGYAPTDYVPVNPPLVVKGSGVTLADPARWQPLEIDNMVTQNGIAISLGVQKAVGVHWGRVRPFALPSAGTTGVPIDPGPPPAITDPRSAPEVARQLVDVIRRTSLLGAPASTTMDISPSAYGNNPLGTNDGTGHAKDPATDAPYPPNIVPVADFGRVLAEFWADGPNSETPPGHWNVLANEVSDQLDPELRIDGTGEPVGRLEWDVKLYLALNGAVHDAAIEAWGLKGRYDSIRPISLIRYMGGRGQSSDPALPSFDPLGLPLVPGVVELVTAEETVPGRPMAVLAGHEGQVATRSWLGRPADTDGTPGGIGWRLAVDWVPYQPATFVTPAFPAYVSGHSTFSRAAAEVLAGFTGSPFFPGGLKTHVAEPGSLRFEAGPSRRVELQWATYLDAADQAGVSRLWGGIHMEADDLTGRRLGSLCGVGALELARRYSAGTATRPIDGPVP